MEEVCVMKGEEIDENVRQDKINKGVGREITHLHQHAKRSSHLGPQIIVMYACYVVC